MEEKWLNIQSSLKRYLRRFLNREEDVEDIVQETYIKVLEAGSKGKIHYPKAYLYRTAHNLALNALARKSSQLEDFIEDLSDSSVMERGQPLEDQVMAQKQFELFCRAVAELPDQCRTVLVLCKVYGFSHREISQQLNISISTVEKHLAKGLLKSAAYIKRHENPKRLSEEKKASAKPRQL